MINQLVNSGIPSVNTEERSKTVQVSEPAQPVDLPSQQAALEEENPQQLEQAVTQLNDFAQNIQRTLNFSVEEVTGQTVVQVFDSETDELIRQIPSEEAIKLASAIEEQARSLLLNEQA